MTRRKALFIDEGAVVFANVSAYGAENVKILGRGILDNSHNKEEILFEVNAESNDADVRNARRIKTIQLEYCTDIVIDGITIRDSLVYNIRPIACKNMTISDVKIIGCWRYNSDGIDMYNCENVMISNCFLRTFDDSICVKGFDFYQNEDDMYKDGKCYNVMKNVTVDNCTIWNDWGKCLEIGAETRAKSISNIVFKNCNLIHVTNTVLDCMNVDYADIHDVKYENISVEYDEILPTPVLQRNDAEKYENVNPEYAPDLICGEVVFHPEYSAGGQKRGKIRNMSYNHIRLIGRQKPTFCFRGFDEEHMCSDITVTNLYWNEEKVTELSAKDFVVGDYCQNIVSDFKVLK